MLICGASFAGLAVARELDVWGTEVLIIDRYQIGERQDLSPAATRPIGCGQLGLIEAERQRFDSLLMHTRHGEARYRASLDLLDL